MATAPTEETKKVLFMYGERKFVRNVGDESVEVIGGWMKTEFDIKNTVVLQKFDDTWGEWVDIATAKEIQNKDKIKVLSCKTTTLEDCAACDSTTGAISKNTLIESEEQNADQAKGESSTSTSQIAPKILSDQTIRKISKIYGFNNENAKLTKWQEAVNAEAYKLAKRNHELLYKRGELKQLAEAEARKTYIFKKKSGSRSNDVVDNDTKPKRAKLNADDRKEKMSSLSVQLELISKEILSKENLCDRATAVKDFNQCAVLQSEMRKLAEDKLALKMELKTLQEKETRSNQRTKKPSKRNQLPVATDSKPRTTHDIRGFLSPAAESSPPAKVVITLNEDSATARSQTPESDQMTATAVKDTNVTEDAESKLSSDMSYDDDLSPGGISLRLDSEEADAEASSSHCNSEDGSFLC